MAKTTTNSREFDLVIYGATGFTGLRTASYIARAYPEDNLKWAIAGRNISKLEQIREQLVAINPKLSNLGLIKADASSIESLYEMAARTKVILTTVGPFMLYGEPLVEACVKQGTHYIDVTGEAPFIDKIVKKYHKEAVEKNVILVPSCGFDSVPSDLGAFMVVDYLRSVHNVPTESVKMTVTRLRGGASGGTLASACEIMESKETTTETLTDQNLLVPEEIKAKWPKSSITNPTVYWDPDFKKWQGYFVMSSSNEKVVKRSHGLIAEKNDGEGYGNNFKYTETMSFPGFFTATIATIGMALGAVSLAIGPVRNFARKYILPPPGTGPSDEEIEKGHFTINVIGQAVPSENVVGSDNESESESEIESDNEESSSKKKSTKKPIRAIAKIVGGEPGYKETCRMLVESALCIIKEEDRIRQLNNVKGGILTPASAFGRVLIERLQNKGMGWTVSKL